MYLLFIPINEIVMKEGFDIPSQIAKFMGPTWGHLGPVSPRWVPCWPHEPCYQGLFTRNNYDPGVMKVGGGTTLGKFVGHSDVIQSMCISQDDSFFVSGTCVNLFPHNNDVIMDAMASQITSLTIVYSTVYLGTDQRKQSSASLTLVWGIHRWPVDSPHKGPVTWKMFPFDDVIITHCPSFQYKASLSRYWNFRYNDKMVMMRQSYLYNRSSCTGKARCLYWDEPHQIWL